MSEDGADYINGHVYSYQDANEDKNHNRDDSLPANIQPGMLQSRSDSNRLYHCVVAGAQGLEVLQGDIVCANNEVVCADNEVVFAGYI